jgi:tRNA (cytidine32/uridine32-2'-O)-methyltransferase
MNNVFITLVNPSHPGNIGGVARAMKNMSFQQLRLVKPKREVNEEAFARAAGADDVLEQAEYFPDLAAAIDDCQLVIGTSARVEVPDVIDMPIREAAALIAQAAQNQRVAVLLGREHAGLTNEELAFCHYHVYIPCNTDFCSLNLASAAQVICYELFLALTQPVFNSEKDFSKALATQGEIFDLFEHLAKTLAELDFYDPTNPRRLLQKLRALLNRTHLLKSEVAILRGILAAVDKK